MENGIPNSPNPKPSLGKNSEEVSLRQRFLRIQTLLSFMVAFGVLAFALFKLNIDWSRLWDSVKQANPLFFVAAFLIYYASFPIRGLRWRILLENAGLGNKNGVRLPSIWGLAEIIFLGWLANCIIPAKLGDAYRAYLLKKNAGVSFSATVGNVVAERVIDMVILFLMLAAAALGILGGRYAGTALTMLGVGLALVALILALMLAMRFWGSKIQRLLPVRLQSIYLRFQEGTLGSFKRLPLLTLLTVVTWLMESGRLWLVTASLGFSVSVPMIIFIALANSLLTVIPFTPGGLGLVELGVTGLLVLSVTKEQALSIVLLDRTISYWSIIVLGSILLLVSRKK